MEFTPKTIQLKNGLSCLLRSPDGADGEAILAHLAKASDETDFLSRSGAEVLADFSPEAEARFLADMLAAPRAGMIAAFVDGQAIANASITPVSPLSRCRHRAELGIAIQQAFCRLGLGSALLDACIHRARAANYTQLELGVVDTNAPAIALYEKFGFTTCGCIPAALRYPDGRQAGELRMILPLSSH